MIDNPGGRVDEGEMVLRVVMGGDGRGGGGMLFMEVQIREDWQYEVIKVSIKPFEKKG